MSERPSSATQSLLKWLNKAFFVPLFGLVTAAFGCVALALSLFDRSGRWQHQIARLWATAMLRLSFSPVTVVHPERLQQPGPAVYVSNHLSYMDTPVIFSKLPLQFRILAKHRLWSIPFIGWYLRHSGQIPVDSSSMRSSIASLNKGVRALQSGMSLFIFPEGGRSEDGTLQDFMSGPAYLAVRAGVPIVPIALIGTYELLPVHVYHLHPRPLKMVVGDAIPTAQYTTRTLDELTAKTREAISRLYFEHLEPVPSTVVDDQQTPISAT